MRFFEVDPNTFIVPSASQPAHGRGCWIRTGIDFDYRYALAPAGQVRIGTKTERSLDHWAVGIGCYAIQQRLAALGVIPKRNGAQRGVFNPAMKAAVIKFQEGAHDPSGGAALDDDGTVGRSDARALFTPVVTDCEKKYAIPDRYLLGEMYHESQLDPGAVGYYIYYPDFRGVDRGIAQINSKAQTAVSWEQAFDVNFAADWSAQRLRSTFDGYLKKYPTKDKQVLWDAAICSHNNPSAGGIWASKGAPPTETAAAYVAAVKAARY